MAQKKESYFWTSYSDLMTSLFFVMLVLFILVIVVLHKRMEATEQQLEEIQAIAKSTEELNNSEYFSYRPEYKKYVLNIKARYPIKASDINLLISDNKDELLAQIVDAGQVISDFLKRHKENQYILIVEGQSSSIHYEQNYQLSYERALALIKFWMEDSGITFGDNCEILISGSGDGTIDTHSMRESEEEDKEINQRFLIHILPKNVFESKQDDID